MNSDPEERNLNALSSEAPKDVEDALHWLDELTVLQGKPSTPTQSSPSAKADSPFHDLIESDEGDFPDWLREAPGASQVLGDEVEFESRLDWLAKMSQHESIEELPTLEWRRLTEPVQNAMWPRPMPNPEEDVLPGDAGAEDLAVDSMAPVDEAPDPSATGSEESLQVPPDIEATEASEEQKEAFVETEVIEADFNAIDDSLVFSEIGPNEDLPSANDLDEAMAWIEELAASEDAPVEDIPSVADRALALKLMTEAGINGADSVDELISDSDLMEGNVPMHPFIAEEDYADTIVLAETLAAEQGVPMEPTDDPENESDGAVSEAAGADAEDTIPLTREHEVNVPGAITSFAVATGEDRPFDEAMAYLDEMAIEQTTDSDSRGAAEPVEGLAVSENEFVDEEGDSSVSTGLQDAEAIALAGLAVDALESERPGETTEAGNDLDMPVHDYLAGEAYDADGLTGHEPAFPGDMDEAMLREMGFLPEDDISEAPTMAFIILAHEEEELPAPEHLRDEDVPWSDAPVDKAALIIADDRGPDDLIVSEANKDPVGDDDQFEATQEMPAERVHTGETGPEKLEDALLALDALALPAGGMLIDISSPPAAQSSSVRDISGALDWLESALAIPGAVPAQYSDLVDDHVFDDMPDDPDAVLAWLEQAAGAEADATLEPADFQKESAEIEIGQADPFDELRMEADLMNMPDDPDGAIAFMMGLSNAASSDAKVPAEDLAAEQQNEFDPEAVVFDMNDSQPVAEDTESLQSDEHAGTSEAFQPEEAGIVDTTLTPADRPEPMEDQEVEPEVDDDSDTSWLDWLKPLE